MPLSSRPTGPTSAAPPCPTIWLCLAGLVSADWRSLREFSSGGFTAIFIPFYSTTYLPYERGVAVTDFRLYKATRENGREPKYYCARYTLDGAEIVQGCNRDPRRNDALVRQMMSQMVEQLKKGHFIDEYSRMVSLHLQCSNANSGLFFTVRYMFELTAMRSVLPSFDIEALVTNKEKISMMKVYLAFALAMTCWFCMLELVEMTQAGLWSYLSNPWNVLDWANFLIFFQAFVMFGRTILLHEEQVEMELAEVNGPPFECNNMGGRSWSEENDITDFLNDNSFICTHFGYFDPYEKMFTAREARFYMALCICIQLLKIVKFTNVIVPKMSLMTRVLGVGAADLTFFGLVFGISLFSFTMLLYIQIGSFMDDFSNQVAATVALVRALFGDFSFEEIGDNSKGYLNVVLFLVYLFIAVFILLSMFLSILGESQANAREEERKEKEAGEFVDYGTFQELWHSMRKRWRKWRAKRKGEEEDEDEDEEGGEEDEEPEQITKLKIAMMRMQDELEKKVQKRTGDFEQRVLKGIASFEGKLRERQLRAAKGGGSAFKTPNGANGAKSGGGVGGGARSASVTGGRGCSSAATSSFPRKGNTRSASATNGLPDKNKAAGAGAAGETKRDADRSRGARSAERAPRGRTPSPTHCKGASSSREASPVKRPCNGGSGMPSCSADRVHAKGGAGASRSHPGKSFERGWSKSRSAAHVAEATGKRPGAKGGREPKDPAGVCVEDEYAC